MDDDNLPALMLHAFQGLTEAGQVCVKKSILRQVVRHWPLILIKICPPCPAVAGQEKIELHVYSRGLIPSSICANETSSLAREQKATTYNQECPANHSGM